MHKTYPSYHTHMAKKGSSSKATTAATAALTLLATQGIEHTIHQFEAGKDNFGEEAAAHLAAEGIEADQIFKTLLFDLSAGKTPKPELAVAIVPVTGRLSLKHAAAALGHGKAIMADPKVAERATGYITGGISPLGQKTLFPTVIDETAILWDKIFVSGGKRGLDIGIAPDDLIMLTKAVTADILEGH